MAKDPDQGNGLNCYATREDGAYLVVMAVKDGLTRFEWTLMSVPDEAT